MEKILHRKMVFLIQAKPSKYIVTEDCPGGKWVPDEEEPTTCALITDRAIMEKAMDEIRVHRDEPGVYVVQALPRDPVDEFAQDKTVESILDMIENT